MVSVCGRRATFEEEEEEEEKEGGGGEEKEEEELRSYVKVEVTVLGSSRP